MLRVREAKESGDAGLVVGGARSVDGRCIIPIIRTLEMHLGGAATVRLTPVALLVVEGEHESLTLLPGAPATIAEIVGRLQNEIEREKKRCTG
ncbi:MAG: hypothetical protein CVV31_10950 [Methanomicrobiales archaeon HGW-Methanomicrobiales-2]|nr:MAG: hypothetical protein CVV31_10950 [Methanomicrobiales archaeon HGW-Methanomicrobiales-2]